MPSTNPDLPEELLGPLLSASNSSFLEEALDVLIESSRTADGRAELASRDVLPVVLNVVEALQYPSCRQFVALSLKLLRNLCAGQASCQNSFIERRGIEVLANVSQAGEENRLAIWRTFFPDEFLTLAKVRSQETIDPLCMIIYTCSRGSTELLSELSSDRGLCLLAEVVRTVSSVGFGEDWFKSLVSRVCVEAVHFPRLFSKLSELFATKTGGETEPRDNLYLPEQAFLLRIISEIINERIEEIVVPRDFALSVLGILKRSIGAVDFSSRGDSALPTASTAIDVLGYSLTILRDICARDYVGELEEDSADIVDPLLSSGLVELLFNLLGELEPPEIVKKALNDGQNSGLNSVLPKVCPYKGYRRDLVSVIGNCAYRRKHVQDKIRQQNGILLLLQQCVTDEENPFLREWGIWSVRNVLEGNAENQQAVADLELQGSVDVPELARLGLRVEVDQRTRRAKLVNAPGSHPNPDK